MAVYVGSFFEMLWALNIVFISCELAERVTNVFDEIMDVIGQFNWYLFPIELKQLLPTAISNAHREIGIECFGSVLCNRKTFKIVSGIEMNNSNIGPKQRINILFPFSGGPSSIFIFYGSARIYEMNIESQSWCAQLKNGRQQSFQICVYILLLCQSYSN